MIRLAAAIIVGSIFIAIGVNYFVIPHHLLEGGMIGIGLIGKYIFGLPPGLTTIVLSIPLYFIAFFYNRHYFYNGIHGLLVSSFFIDWFSPISVHSPIPILVSILSGGLIIGIGISILLLHNISNGGMDLMALILSKITAINVGIYILCFDSIVIVTGSILIPETAFLHSALLVGMIGLTVLFITTYLTPKKVATHLK